MGSISTTTRPGRLDTDLTGEFESAAAVPPGSFPGLDATTIGNALAESLRLKREMAEEQLARSRDERRYRAEDRRRARAPRLEAASPQPVPVNPLAARRRELFQARNDLNAQLKPFEGGWLTSAQPGSEFYNLPAAGAMTGVSFPSGFDVYSELLRSAGGVR